MSNFADLMDVQAYDAATGSFICASGYIGHLWQTEPLAGVNADLESQIKGMLQLDLPDQSYLTFTLVADDNLLPYYEEYSRIRAQQQQVVDLAASTQARLEFFQNLQELSYDAQAPCNLRNYILIVGLKLHYKGSLTPEVLEDYMQYAAQTTSALHSIFGQVHKLNDREYLFFMRNLLLGKTYQESAQLDAKFHYYDPYKTLAQQLLSPSSEIIVHKNCLEIDGQLLQVFTPIEIPAEFACGQAISYLGDMFTGITPLTQKFFLTCSLFFVNQLAAKSVVETKKNYTIRQMTGPLARFVPRLKQTAEAFEVLISDLNAGDKLVKFSWTLVAWLPPEATYQDYQATSLQQKQELSSYLSYLAQNKADSHEQEKGKRYAKSWQQSLAENTTLDAKQMTTLAEAKSEAKSVDKSEYESKVTSQTETTNDDVEDLVVGHSKTADEEVDSSFMQEQVLAQALAATRSWLEQQENTAASSTQEQGALSQDQGTLTQEQTSSDQEQASLAQKQASSVSTARNDKSIPAVNLGQIPPADQQLLYQVKTSPATYKGGGEYSRPRYRAGTKLPQAQAFAVKVKSYFQTIGWLVDFENQVQVPVFLNALPLNQDKKARTFLQRERTMSTTQATVCLPLFAEWKASGSPVVPLISRTGQIMNVDLFASQTNFNCCIAAQSGSGKSFLVNEMVANLLATGAQCWIIDIGRSYKKLAQVYQGEFVEFSVDADININPFALVQNYSQDADMLFTLIQTMISPKDMLSEYQANAVKQMIKDLWDEHGTQMHIDLLAQALEAHEDTRLQDLAVQLFPFTSRGAYGVYFRPSGRNMINLLQDLEKQQQSTANKSRLVVLELEELSGRKDLQQLVLLQLIFAVNQQMISGQKQRQKVLFIDEAWDLLASKTISYFIETGYRRFRKYNGAVVTITQSLEDLYNTASGRAIAANSANYFLLAQKTETVKQLLSQYKLVLDAGSIRQITSLKTRKGHFSEIFFHTDYGSGVGRLIVSPQMQLLYSTNAVDIAALTRIQELYQCNLWNAIEILLLLRQELHKTRS
ncbi:TraC family protein [Psittacicella hinzii]|nr:TraC family protein [Psittacicella hinzii]